MIAGVLNRFEVWIPEDWDNLLRESKRLLDDLSVQLLPVSSKPLDASVAHAPSPHPQGKPHR